MTNQNENAAVSDVTARMRKEASIRSLLNGQQVCVESVGKKLREFADSIDAAVSKMETIDGEQRLATVIDEGKSDEGRAGMMKIHFEKIGRNNKTFDAQINDALLAKCGLNPKIKNRYGDEHILCALCDEYNFLRGQVRACMMSTPDFDLTKDGNRIGVFAGWNLVGEAWLVRDGKGGAE